VKTVTAIASVYRTYLHFIIHKNILCGTKKRSDVHWAVLKEEWVQLKSTTMFWIMRWKRTRSISRSRDSAPFQNVKTPQEDLDNNIPQVFMIWKLLRRMPRNGAWLCRYIGFQVVPTRIGKKKEIDSSRNVEQFIHSRIYSVRVHLLIWKREKERNGTYNSLKTKNKCTVLFPRPPTLESNTWRNPLRKRNRVSICLYRHANRLGTQSKINLVFI
jgi:hypothetical protein